MLEKLFRFTKKKSFVDIGFFVVFSFLFLLLNWRLFAFGSQEQLFLYGDNLPILNNLFYLFNNFSFLHPFATLIGQNGMLGSYPMAEPQNSIFYPPITFLFVVYKLFHLQAVGLYYELLFLHTTHFLVGVFFIYKICHKILKFSRPESFFAGVVYLGLGWNAAWFGTGTLSYMIGLLPLMMYVFLNYLQKPTIRQYLIFVLAMIMFLYAGGLINFFFYLLTNFFVLFTVFVYFKYDRFFVYTSKKECAIQYGLIFLLAPILSLFAYSVQLFITYSVSADISHASSSYDYLAFFGLHFYDLIGVLFPKFALLQFGWVTNPQILLDFSLANVLYIGFLPLILTLIGVVTVKGKEITLLACMMCLNLLIAFGGAFPLYDATYFFPGNGLFRGHYKYLFIVGIYLSLSIPFVLRALREKKYDMEIFEKIQKYVVIYFFVLLATTIVCSLAAFSFKVLRNENSLFPLSYFTLALTFSSYLFRMFLIGCLSWFFLNLVLRYSRNITMILLVVIFVVDISVNFKYNMYYSTTIQDITSKNFFQCCQNKTVIIDIERYTQAYHIPEISGVDPFFYYSAIPNRYLAAYNGHLKNANGQFNVNLMKSAGIDGVLTTSIINDVNFTLIDSKEITLDNYTQLYSYNFNGDIHNDWGSDYRLIGQTMRYYSLKESKKAYFTTGFSEQLGENQKLDKNETWENMIGSDSISVSPILSVDTINQDANKQNKPIHSDVVFLENRPVYKKIALNNESGKGLLYVTTPYSSIWKAKVNGVESKVYRANVVFSAVKIKDKHAIVEFYIDTKWYTVYAWGSIVLVAVLIVCFYMPMDVVRKYLKK